jgi:hypothetical protein
MRGFYHARPGAPLLQEVSCYNSAPCRIFRTGEEFPLAILTLTDEAALLGMILGSAGFAMSLMNYLRDRPKVRVTLTWDMTKDGIHNIGVVRVTNTGRRPIYISIVALRVPKGAYPYLVLKESIPGQKLSEGLFKRRAI